MGNYSYLSDQQGCELDLKKLQMILGSWDNEYLDYVKEKDNWEHQELGEWLDGWKIQGYWYDEFVEFLYACAYSMKGLTEEKYDNQIEMEEEQGFKFVIHFFLEEGKPNVSVDYVPMEWNTIKFDRPNKPIQKRIE